MTKINLEIKIKKDEFRKKLDIKDGAPGEPGPKGDALPGPKGEDGSPDTPEETRDKLESLKKGNKLSIEAIEDLPKILQDLSKRKEKKSIGLVGGGSIHARSTEFRFKDDETPSGTVDGANASFILLKTPVGGSLKVYRGGARQRITEDYTLSGKTITFILVPQVGEIILCDYRY